MSGMPFNLQEKAAAAAAEEAIFWSSGCGANKWRKGAQEGPEPTSVLDKRSPSPPTSSSTLSSSRGGAASSDTAAAATVAVSGNPATNKCPPPDPTTPSPSSAAGAAPAAAAGEWAAELQPIQAGPGASEDWEAMFSYPTAELGQEQTFLRWIMGDADEVANAAIKPPQFPSHGGRAAELGFGFDSVEETGASYSCLPAAAAVPPFASSSPTLKDPTFVGHHGGHACPSPALSLPPGPLFQEPGEEKPLFLYQSLLFNQNQPTPMPPNPAFFLPQPQSVAHLESHPQPKRHPSTTPHPTPQISSLTSFPNSFCPEKPLFSQLSASPLHTQPSTMRPKVVGDEVAASLVDQLFQAAELAEAGNFAGTHGILARLNHLLPSPTGNPLLRASFYFKEALHLLTSNAPRPVLSNPLDVILKLSAHKALAEVSPIAQFTNFTCTQALLEELSNSTHIHVIDFDLGFGGQWSSFMQELAQRWRCTATPVSPPLLKITAFFLPGSYHPLELQLTRENLVNFAAGLGIPFEFNAASLDPYDSSMHLGMPARADEAVAVNLPVGFAAYLPLPAMLRLVKQLSPKIVMSVNHWCDRGDLPFTHHFFQALQSCVGLLDSFDTAAADADAKTRIERFVVQPRIESLVLGRHRMGGKMLPWTAMFASCGFAPVQFSNATETQAECLLKRIPVPGFHVEKCQASLSLCWQRGELVSVSAWRC